MTRSMFQRGALVALTAGAATTSAVGQTEIPVAVDYMSSGFFQSDYLRGEEDNSARATNRATSPVIFDTTGETTYFGFEFNPGDFGGPVPEAFLRVESVTTGFFPDPSPDNPAEISLHSLTADPLASIDQDVPDGPGSWLEFRDNQITIGSIVSTTTVDGLGVFEWDITSLVNEWIANGDANFVYTIGTSALLDPEGGAAIAFPNSSFSGLGDEVIATIVVVPAPGALALLSVGGLVIARRRR